MGRAYYEDLEVGFRFAGGSYRVDPEEMMAFARKWDPRSIHLDEEAGREAGFGGVIASGQYTISILTLLSLRARQAAGDQAFIAALGSENRLPHPVRAGDTLSHEAEIVSKRESRSRPEAGIVRTRFTLTNQDGVVVLVTEATSLLEKRPTVREERA